MELFIFGSKGGRLKSQHHCIEALLIVFDLTDGESFAATSKILEAAKEQNPDVKCMLVGTKSDSAHHRMVPYEKARNFADENNMLWVPGCMTPSEIIRAETLGAKMIKLFPGNILGPEFMSAIKALFPDLLFMPTGGVDLDKENIAGWLKAGVCAVGMGSKLISKPLLEQKDYAKIEELARQALDILKSLK